MQEAIKVAMLGMGTVFLSLTLLYTLMLIMGKALSVTTPSSHIDESVEPVKTTSEHEIKEGSSAKQISASKSDDIAVAITLALVRHRSASIAARGKESEGENPWKMAGRLRGMRKT